jgi:hypothetical protein
MNPAIKFLVDYQTMVDYRIAMYVVLAVVAAWAVWAATSRESFSSPRRAPSPRKLPPHDPAAKKFSWVPGPKGTYVFADPPSKQRSLDPALDAALRRAVDALVPRTVLDGAGDPQPTPFVDTQAEDVAREALSRLDKAKYDLDLMSLDFSAAAVDKHENVRYDISLLAYDRVKNVTTKLALTALVTPGGRTYVKKFEAFNRDPVDKGPEGSDGTMQPVMTEYATDLGIDYDRMYPV